MKKNLLIVILLAFTTVSAFAQGDYLLQKRGNVTVTWRLVSDFVPQGATCVGWTYHVFVYNENNFAIQLKENDAYQNQGDNSNCWRSGSVSLSNKIIPAGRWVDFTFKVFSGNDGKPGSPGLRYNIDWTQY